MRYATGRAGSVWQEHCTAQLPTVRPARELGDRLLPARRGHGPGVVGAHVLQIQAHQARQQQQLQQVQRGGGPRVAHQVQRLAGGVGGVRGQGAVRQGARTGGLGRWFVSRAIAGAQDSTKLARPERRESPGMTVTRKTACGA